MPTTIAKKLILHVGLHKTGTTAIQAGLARQAGFLHHSGYCQAVMQWDLTYLHEAFNPKAYGKTRDEIDLPRIRERFRRWARRQDCDTIILSGEGMSLFFWDLRGHNDEVGSSLFTGFADTTLLLYFRRQDLFLESVYHQLVKDGLCDSLEEFLTHPRVDLWCNFDWHAKARRLQSLYPQARLLVKLYEQAIEDGDIFRDFLRSIGIDNIPDQVATTEENVRLDGRMTELIRVCNKHRDPKHRQALISLLRKGITPAGMERLQAPRLRADQRIPLIEHYHESNARLFAEHGLGDMQRWEQITAADETGEDCAEPPDERTALAMIDQLLARAKADD